LLVSKQWKKINPNPFRPDLRSRHNTCLHEQKLFVFGGYGTAGYFNDIWSLDLKTFVWTKNTSSNRLSPLMSGPTFMSAFKQNILIFGGTAPNTDSDEVFFFDINLEKWDRTKLGAKIPPLGPLSAVLSSKNHEFIISDQNDFYKLSLDLSKFGDQKNENLIFQKQMKSLFERNDYYDVKFRVEGQEIPAYKGILISRSPYFPKMFASGMKESQNQVIDVPGVKYEVYRKLIEYLYCEEIDIRDEIAVELLKLAHEYSLPALVNRCGKCLVKTIKNENFLELANLADSYQAEELQMHLFRHFLSFKQSLLEILSPKEMPRFLLEEFMETYA
jgi:hypothetical protein